MGFDNECILNIQSLAGEYFCPVCRLLVNPNEAVQTLCSHLFCKACLSYVVATTRACPYDGYLVTEADSKPLESNKALSDSIGEIAVKCLFHRSGCTWQGKLSEVNTHCPECQFGNSPVICNRCSAQIVHRQVQEHAQICPGVHPQTQPVEGAQDIKTVAATAVVADQTQATPQTGAPTNLVPTQVTAAPPANSTQPQTIANSQPQAATQGQVVLTQEQWYQQQQQQYQQYYQQYPGYDPYQQQYQQYAAYQMAPPQQYQIQAQPLQGQPQPQMYMQPLPMVQGQVQVQASLLPQAQPPPLPQVPMQTQPLQQGQQPSQMYPQAQLYPQQVQPYPQHRPPVPQNQQPNLQVQHPQALPFPSPQTQPLSIPQAQGQPQNPIYPPMPAQPYPQANIQQSPALTSQNPYTQPQLLQQMATGPPQHPMPIYPQQPSAPNNPPQAQGQYVQPVPPQMQPLHPSMPMQQPAMVPPQAPQHPGQPANQYPHQQPPFQQSQSFPGQTPGLVQNTQPGEFVQPLLRPPGPPGPMQHPNARPQMQQNVPGMPEMQPHLTQSHAGRPMLTHQQFQQPPTGHYQTNAVHPGSSQTYPPNMNVRPQTLSEQQPSNVYQSSYPQSGGAPHPGMNSQISIVDASSQEAETKGVDESTENSDKNDNGKGSIKEESESKEAASNDAVSAVQNGGSKTPVNRQLMKEDGNGKLEDLVGEKSLPEDKALNGDPNRKNISPHQTNTFDAKVQNLSSHHERWPQLQLSRQGHGHLQGNNNRPPTLNIQEGQHGQLHPPDQILPPPPQIQGTGYPPFQMRSQGFNSLGTLPPQGQSSASPRGILKPGATSFGTGPNGPSQGGFDSNPVGHYNQGHRHHAPPTGVPPLVGPPHAAFDSQGGLRTRSSALSEANRLPGYFDGSVEHPPFGHPSNVSRISGGLGKGFREEQFKSFTDDRYNADRFNPLREGRFRPFPNEQGRHLVDHRDFEEDIKPFAIPPHLDPDHPNYFPSSRNPDRVPHRPFIHDFRPPLESGASRTFPPHRPGGLRPVGRHDDSMGKNVDPLGVHPDFLRSAMDSGRHRGEGLHSLRTGGRDYSGIPSDRFGRFDDIDSRDSRLFGEGFRENIFPLPNDLHRGDHDGPRQLHIGGQMGSGPSDFVGFDDFRWGERGGFGAFPNHSRMGGNGRLGNMSGLRIGEPMGGNLPVRGRKGELGFRSSFPNRGFPSEGGSLNQGDGESLDQSKKRKQSSSGFCRICKVECNSVEGLDAHSLTKEHQKMAMDMVRNIKKDSAKKLKVSEDHASNEDENKTISDRIESNENDA